MRKIGCFLVILIFVLSIALSGCGAYNTHNTNTDRNADTNLFNQMSEEEKAKLNEAIKTGKSNIVIDDSFKPENVKAEIQEAKVIEFWVWFSTNSEKFYNFEENREKDLLLSDANNKLKEIHKNLSIMIGTKKDGKREIIVTANGIVTSFPYVKGVVDRAGTYDKFKIVPFKQRNDETESKVGSFSLKYEDLSFKWKEDKDKHRMVVDIYVKRYQDINSEIKTAVFNLLDNSIGEYDVETKISYIDIKSYKDDIKDSIPFKDFRNTVDSFSKGK